MRNRDIILIASAIAVFFLGWGIRFAGDYTPWRLIMAGACMFVSLVLASVFIFLNIKK